MNYLENEISHARKALEITEALVVTPPSRAFDLGMSAGFNIACEAFGIWRNGTQRIGASDKDIKECMEEFKRALLRTQPDSPAEGK